MCVTWCIHVYDLTDSRVTDWRVTRLISMCATTHFYVSHVSFMYVTLLILRHGISNSYVGHDSGIRVTWLWYVYIIDEYTNDKYPQYTKYMYTSPIRWWRDMYKSPLTSLVMYTHPLCTVDTYHLCTHWWCIHLICVLWRSYCVDCRSCVTRSYIYIYLYIILYVYIYIYSFMYLYVAHDSLVCLYTSCIYCADRTADTANALWSIDVSIYINLYIYINIPIHISVYITWFTYLYIPIIRSTVGTAWTARALWRIDISIYILSYIYTLIHISIHTLCLSCRSYCVDYRSSCRSPTPSLQPLVAHSSNLCKHRELNKGGGGLGGRVDQGGCAHLRRVWCICTNAWTHTSTHADNTY